MAVTVINPGTDINATATGASAGDTFILTTGTFSNQKILPLDGQTFIGQEGVILDGGSSTDYCFYYDDAVRHPRGVTLRNFTIQNYTGGSGRGAILGDNTVQWVIDHVEITLSGGRGIETGPGMILRSCYIHGNQLEGINGYQSTGLCIEDCEISNNNTSHNNPDTGSGEGSGMKLGTCSSVRVRNTFVHDNYGPGLWFDADCYDIQVVGCNTLRNTHRGIQVEISDTVLLSGNLHVLDGVGQALPGAAAVFISSSSNVEITGCTALRCGNGISAYTDASRGTGPNGVREVRNLNVHDNLIRQNTGVVAGLQDSASGTQYFLSKGNVFDGNTYEQPFSNTGAFLWMNNSRTWGQWQKFGLDHNGTAVYF